MTRDDNAEDINGEDIANVGFLCAELMFVSRRNQSWSAISLSIRVNVTAKETTSIHVLYTDVQHELNVSYIISTQLIYSSLV